MRLPLIVLFVIIFVNFSAVISVSVSSVKSSASKTTGKINLSQNAATTRKLIVLQNANSASKKSNSVQSSAKTTTKKPTFAQTAQKSKFGPNAQGGKFKLGALAPFVRFEDIDDMEKTSFEIFKTAHNKIFHDENHEKKSLMNYAKNARKINEHNDKYQKGEVSYDTAVWERSDVDDDEFRQNFTGYVTQPRARVSELVYDVDPNLPKNLNYSALGLVTRVMDQAACGSCYSFATAGVLEGHIAKKTGKLVQLSAQNLIDCSRNDTYGNFGCMGGNPLIAYDYVKNYGINAAINYPYKGNDISTCKFNKSISLGNVADFVYVASGNETALMYALYKSGGPIAIAIDSSDVTFRNYKSGIYDYAYCYNYADHAVLLVGYGVDTKYAPPKPYWLIKNSWGKNWGENGYFRLLRDANNLCQVATDAHYPLIA